MKTRFAEAMLAAAEFREENRPPATPKLVARRNDLAQTRLLIDARREQIRKEITALEAEDKELIEDWNRTCPEWDRIWARGMA